MNYKRSLRRGVVDQMRRIPVERAVLVEEKLQATSIIIGRHHQ